MLDKLQQYSLWGQAFEIAVKRGVLLALLASDIRKPEKMGLEPWMDIGTADVYGVLGRELKEVDPNRKDRARETVRHLFQLGMGLGETAMREYLRNLKEDAEDYTIRALWCPLQLPRVSADFDHEREESLAQFWAVFGLDGLPDRALTGKGFPARADFLLWLEPRYEKHDQEFLCLEFSLNGFPESADYGKPTAHLDELRRYAWFVDSRCVFSRVCAEVSGEGFGQKVDCLIGDSLLSQQNYMLAAEKYTSCYLSDTIDKKPMVSLANCYMQLGDYTLAKKYYHLLEIDSLYKTEAILKLAIIYESQQNLPKAIKYYRAISMVYPENPIYLRKLGNLYLQGRETKQALESFQKAYQINPRDLLTIQGLTEFYLNGDDLGKADSLTNNGIKIDSNNVGLLLLKSRIRYRVRDYRTTADILHKLTYQTELNNFYNKLLGYSFIQIDSLDKAIYHLQISLLDENDPEYALFYLALAHEKKKEYSKAEWFFREAAKAGISDNMSQYHTVVWLGSTHISKHTQKSLIIIFGENSFF